MASNIPMQQYYQEKYGWSKTTFEEIDWDLQWRVLTSYDINDQRRILKLVHGWLPTNYRLHRELQQSSPRCPLCYYLEEKETHLFQWQAILNIKNINQELSHIIAESLKHSIKDHNWEPQPKHCQQFTFLAKQMTIGWQHLFFGRISTTLANRLAVGGSNDNSRLTLAKSGMARYMIKTIWDTFLTLWKQRNEIIHGTQETTKAERQRQALHQKVQKCYEYQNQLHLRYWIAKSHMGRSMEGLGVRRKLRPT
jgi:hypothetical protein